MILRLFIKTSPLKSLSVAVQRLLKIHRRGHEVSHVWNQLRGDTERMEHTTIDHMIKHVLLNTWLCEENALADE